MTKIIQKVNAVKIEPPREETVWPLMHGYRSKKAERRIRSPLRSVITVSSFREMPTGNMQECMPTRQSPELTTDRPEFQGMLQDARDGKSVYYPDKIHLTFCKKPR